MTIFDELRRPFPPERVSWRVGATNGTRGLALAYIDARDVMERLDEIVGPAGWQCRYPHANGKTVCEIGIFYNEEWIWKADGAGDTDVEAEKGALSDAFKRAAVRWGLGRYLYDIESVWVEIEQHGKSKVIKQSEYAKLARLLGGNAPAKSDPLERSASFVETSGQLIQEMKTKATAPALKAWGTDPRVKARIAGLTEDGQATVREAYMAHMDDVSNLLPAG